MAKVLGIGGVFIKSVDEDAVKQWYRDVLGFEVAEWGGAIFAHVEGGQTVWSAFPASSSYFEPSTVSVMINLTVDDLDGVLARAAAAGVEPVGRDDQDENGRFAWILDPTGIKLELWQPKVAQETP